MWGRNICPPRPSSKEGVLQLSGWQVDFMANGIGMSIAGHYSYKLHCKLRFSLDGSLCKDLQCQRLLEGAFVCPRGAPHHIKRLKIEAIVQYSASQASQISCSLSPSIVESVNPKTLAVVKLEKSPHCILALFLARLQPPEPRSKEK